MNDYYKIEEFHKELIDIAKDYMLKMDDFEHNMNHVEDVLYYTKELVNLINEDIDKDVCIISAYWHDVGRIKSSDGHEFLSAEMLKEEMIKLNYNEAMIDKCYCAIKNHKWDMLPETIEGLVLKDADKLAWLGIGRWRSCLENGKRLDEIIKLLPRLRNEILFFEESRKIYDKETIKLIELIHNEWYDFYEEKDILKKKEN